MRTIDLNAWADFPNAIAEIRGEYGSHSVEFDDRTETQQNVILFRGIKISIPRSDRVSALRQLEDYNINHYTLFHSEDALIRSLGLQAFELD